MHLQYDPYLFSPVERYYQVFPTEFLVHWLFLYDLPTQAYFSKIFNGCPLKLLCAGSWTHPVTQSEFYLHVSVCCWWWSTACLASLLWWQTSTFCWEQKKGCFPLWSQTRVTPWWSRYHPERASGWGWWRTHSSGSQVRENCFCNCNWETLGESGMNLGTNS